MMKTCVLMDGKVIHVGEWDYCLDESGVERKPLPEGATIEDREFVQDADGGWALETDYVALRAAAYPTYTPFDILDEILKEITPTPGSKLEQIMNERLVTKAQYPKPD